MSWISPPVGFEPGTSWSVVRTANHLATRTLRAARECNVGCYPNGTPAPKRRYSLNPERAQTRRYPMLKAVNNQEASCRVAPVISCRSGNVGPAWPNTHPYKIIIMLVHVLHISKTCLYSFDPLKPHFCIVKLGFTRVYIIFLISAQTHRLWVLVRTASSRRF